MKQLLNGKIPPQDIEIKNEIMTTFKRRKKSYSSALVQTALVRQNETWKNALTKLVLLPKEEKVSETILDYGNFSIRTTSVNVNDFISIVDKLVTKGKLVIKSCPEVLMEGAFDRGDKRYLPSNEEVFGLGWPADFYNFYPKTSFGGRIPSEPLLTAKNPFFPDGSTAIQKLIGLDIARYSQYQSRVLIFLPNYKVRIDEFRIGSQQLTVKILPKGIEKKNIVGKLYCEGDGIVLQKDVLFDEECKVIPTGFIPDHIYMYLLSKETSERLDFRRIYLRWPALPKGVIMEITGEDIRQLIKQGENERVEFKREIGREINEFVETAVAFSNRKGGTILVGIDDKANVVGIIEEDLEDRVVKILRSHCEPPVEPEMRISPLDDKNILVVQIKEGDNKPYTFRDRGVYVRAGATDRIATRDELDEFYSQKYSYRTL